MSVILEDQQDKTHQRKCTIIRLILLLLQVYIILTNRKDQTSNIFQYFPEVTDSTSLQFKEISHMYSAANTLALVFAIMQLLVLYVGTNRFRVRPTFFVVIMHTIGSYLYFNQSRWQFQNIWPIYYVFSFIPLCSQIAVALYTARG